MKNTSGLTDSKLDQYDFLALAKGEKRFLQKSNRKNGN